MLYNNTFSKIAHFSTPGTPEYQEWVELLTPCTPGTPGYQEWEELVPTLKPYLNLVQPWTFQTSGLFSLIFRFCYLHSLSYLLLSFFSFYPLFQVPYPPPFLRSPFSFPSPFFLLPPSFFFTPLFFPLLSPSSFSLLPPSFFFPPFLFSLFSLSFPLLSPSLFSLFLPPSYFLEMYLEYKEQLDTIDQRWAVFAVFKQFKVFSFKRLLVLMNILQ